MTEMECMPFFSAAVVKLALPLTSSTVPRTTLPSMNVTVPLDVPAPGAAAATVAVNVTGLPSAVVHDDASRVDLLAALFTVWLRVGELLPRKFASPEYAAVREWLP